jgi:autotransporter translocation and assembly factor TamB
MTRNRRILLALIAAPFVLLLCTAGLLFAALQTDGGRDFLRHQIESLVSEDGGLTLSLGAVEGNLLSEFRIAGLALADSTGVWLKADDLRVSWSPGDLLGGKLNVGRITLAELSIEREPRLPPGPEEAGGTSSPTLSFDPALPFDVALDHLQIDRIRLGEALAGQEAFFQLSMSLNAAREDSIQSQLNLMQLEGGKAAVRALIEFHPARETLGVDIVLSEPQGGLVARILELPGAPAVELSILGDGRFSSWQGQLLAKAGPEIDADLLVTTRFDETQTDKPIRLWLQGSARVAPLLPPELKPLAAPRVDIEAALSWADKNQKITLESAQLHSSALDAKAEGVLVVPTQAVTGKFTVRPVDSAAFIPIIDPARFESAQINAELSGTLQALSADIAVLFSGFSVPSQIAVGTVTGNFQTSLSPSDLELLPLKGRATLEGITGLAPEVTALLGNRVDVALDLQLDLPENKLNITTVSLEAAGIEASGNATLGLESRAVTSDLAVALTDLSLLGPLSGRLDSNIKLETADFEKTTSLKLSATSQALKFDDPQIQSLVGAEITLEATADSTPVALKINSFDLSTGSGSLAGSAEFPMTFESLRADFDASIPDMAALNDIAGIALTGTGQMRGRLEGPLGNPALAGKVAFKALSLDGYELGVLESDYAASNLLSAPQGQISGRLSHPDAAVDFATAFALHESETLNLEALSLQLADTDVTGSLTVPLNGTPVSGRLKGKIKDLSTVASLAGQSLTGAVDFDVTLKGEGDRQSAVVKLAASRLNLDSSSSEGLTMARLDATFTGQDLLQTPSFSVKAKATDFLSGGFGLDQLELEANGTLEAADFNFAIDKAASPELNVNGAGRVSLGEASASVTMADLSGSFEKRPLQLTQPFTLRQQAGETRLDDLKLRIDGGEVGASGQITDASARADLSLAALPLNLLALIDPQLDMSGTASGRARLDISDTMAAGQLQINVRDVKPDGAEFSDLPVLNGEVNGNLANERLDFTAGITGLEGTSIKASGFLPVSIVLAERSAEIPQDRPLEADLAMRGDLAGLWPLLAIDDHSLNGKLTADLGVTGNLARPQVTGTAALADGRYESLELGTLLTDLQFTAALKDIDRVILSLTSSDGEDGRLAAEGEIDLSDAAAAEIDLVANLTNARLLRRDDVSAQASGKIRLTGQPNSLTVQGEITTDLVEVNINGALPASIVDLPVKELNQPRTGAIASNDQTNGQSAAPATTMALDLDLSLPRRVFIRGRGLDSEWSGKFRVTGTADAPIIEGNLSPVRGDFTFAGKSFKLEKGKISLGGGKDINPDLDLTAVYEAGDLKAIVAITGTAFNPEIALSSEPELPQDEILARVLFGKSTGQLSPVEALQLAEAVATVSGQLGSGEGILGLVRKTLGVDVLSAGTNQNSGEVEVKVGKYLTDDVYVGVNQGADPTSTKVTVEVEVTPNISVQSDVGQDNSGRVGVFWKWDY